MGGKADEGDRRGDMRENPDGFLCAQSGDEDGTN
jgi:hypothetical protein